MIGKPEDDLGSPDGLVSFRHVHASRRRLQGARKYQRVVWQSVGWASTYLLDLRPDTAIVAAARPFGGDVLACALQFAPGAEDVAAPDSVLLFNDVGVEPGHRGQDISARQMIAAIRALAAGTTLVAAAPEARSRRGATLDSRRADQRRLDDACTEIGLRPAESGIWVGPADDLLSGLVARVNRRASAVADPRGRADVGDAGVAAS